MVSRLEHLVFGRCCRRSFAVPVPSISRTERKTASHFLLFISAGSPHTVCSYCVSHRLLQAVSHHLVDICAGVGPLPVWSLHLQNCSSDYRRHGTSHRGKWVWTVLGSDGEYTFILKDNFRILQPRPCFPMFPFQRDNWRRNVLKLVQYSPSLSVTKITVFDINLRRWILDQFQNFLFPVVFLK